MLRYREDRGVWVDEWGIPACDKHGMPYDELGYPVPWAPPIDPRACAERPTFDDARTETWVFNEETGDWELHDVSHGAPDGGLGREVGALLAAAASMLVWLVVRLVGGVWDFLRLMRRAKELNARPVGYCVWLRAPYGHGVRRRFRLGRDGLEEVELRAVLDSDGYDNGRGVLKLWEPKVRTAFDAGRGGTGRWAYGPREPQAGPQATVFVEGTGERGRWSCGSGAGPSGPRAEVFPMGTGERGRWVRPELSAAEGPPPARARLAPGTGERGRWVYGRDPATGKKAGVFRMGTGERGRWACEADGGLAELGAGKGAVSTC
jgi:hypothetical protein